MKKLGAIMMACSLLSSRAWAIPPAPPPPPLADDAALRDAISSATTCFYGTKWERSRDLRFRAEEAVRHDLGQPGSPAWTSARNVVEAYVLSRRDLRKCIAKLTDLMSTHSYSGNNLKASAFALSGMDFNYLGQERYELAVLASLIDREEGRLILETRYPAR